MSTEIGRLYTRNGFMDLSNADGSLCCWGKISNGSIFRSQCGLRDKKNIRYENIVIEDARDKLIDFAILYHFSARTIRMVSTSLRKDHYLNGVWSNVMKIPEARLAEFAPKRDKLKI